MGDTAAMRTIDASFLAMLIILENMVSDVNAALTSDAISSKIVMLIEKHPTIMNAKSKLSGSVVAGFPSPAEQYMEPPLDLNELLVKRPAATYFVRVSGDSMIGAGINDGDILVVDRSLRPADGDIIIACVDGDFTVKRFRERGTGNGERGKHGKRKEETVKRGEKERGDGERGTEPKVWLEPANSNYPTIVLRPEQELDYFGKVTACIHKF